MEPVTPQTKDGKTTLRGQTSPHQLHTVVPRMTASGDSIGPQARGQPFSQIIPLSEATNCQQAGALCLQFSAFPDRDETGCINQGAKRPGAPTTIPLGPRCSQTAKGTPSLQAEPASPGKKQRPCSTCPLQGEQLLTGHIPSCLGTKVSFGLGT